ncbi:translation initiation factor 2 [Paenibacillus sp. 2TAB19]|uniref:translation initiation factor 2 n=1 Tax=Paenibacillus sp. 2TAB19 TaxID=3233003 RepID=UPI003F977818
MDQNNSEKLAQIREIQIARIAFIGASIATIGDGIAALAAGLALEVLENNYEQTSRSYPNDPNQLINAQRNLDHYINELIQLRKSIK